LTRHEELITVRFRCSQIAREGRLSARSRQLSSYRHTWANGYIRMTARRPGTTVMGAKRNEQVWPKLAESGTTALECALATSRRSLLEIVDGG
jgi:hypothetical protein